MANEITIAVQVTHSKDGTTTSFSPSNTDDQTGDGRHHAIHSVSTAAALSFPDLSDPAYVCMWNLDDTNDVEYGTSGTTIDLKIRPGSFALVELKTGESITAQSSSGTVLVDILAIER